MFGERANQHEVWPAYFTLFRRESAKSAARVGRNGDPAVALCEHTAKWRIGVSANPGGAILARSRKSVKYAG